MTQDGCKQLNVSGRYLRDNKILSYHINRSGAIVVSNLVVPCARKESKDGSGYLKSYRVGPAYPREGMDALFD